ncbi:MAG TPA: GIY-YIG nuclease family protein [Spirochaetota bacterium]|nr:GIY-YIG nuclease family protein [Spirochaetota bacterium]HPJ35743.1 GIY-YIG nuclease family protein [Spirochaetota bacterium]
MEKFFTYIIQSESTERYYIGHTHDLDDRLQQHNTHVFRGSISTKRLKGPWKLVYSEQFQCRSEAMKREKQIKNWKSSKAIKDLIEKSSAG